MYETALRLGFLTTGLLTLLSPTCFTPQNDVWFCTADCGWVTGHSYVTYGPLLNGATQVG